MSAEHKGFEEFVGVAEQTFGVQVIIWFAPVENGEDKLADE